MNPRVYDFIIIVAVVAMSVILVGLIQDRQRFERGCETCQLFIDEAKNGVFGFHDPNRDYYCVWTKEQDPVHIKEVEGHELCHALIDRPDGYEHFCEGKKR